jgi:hypothetical protein
MPQRTDWQVLTQEVSADRRAGKRVAIRYAVIVRGIDQAGVPFCDETHTMNVSEEGCCFESPRDMTPGDIVTIRVIRRRSLGLHQFRVMWTARYHDHWTVGAKLLHPENVWGMAFPQKIQHPRPRK